ncbi:putative iron-regulated membrane protein [Isoptericola jiangsuensis]|uniref:Putative iron-regulated membrane protein n=1 Tax=Isoptericola jiangsuensis TaxID=548579 RepID=A0A2A9EZV5_9MICO|nr:PepSY domain-containing protein [Isoptericola jiangsuensis]PFG43689.1 putative iron-regulated membrane protein [Isoptericola jiangsuensis]
MTTAPSTAASTAPAAPPAPPGPPTPPQGSRVWAALQPILLRLHFYAGILVGPFLVVAATTGLLYTLAPTIERVAYRDLLVVEQEGGTVAPLSAQVAAARAAHPEGTISVVEVAGDPAATTRVTLAVDGLPDGAARTVFVDPYTAQVAGDSLTYGAWLPVREWIETLHSSLHLGTYGTLYSELAASWLGVVVLGGVAMWVARAVRRRRTARALLVPERGRPGRRRTLSWHGVVGVLAATGLLVLSVTGLTWSELAGARIGDLRAALSAPGPELDTSLTGGYDADADPHAEHGSAAAGIEDHYLDHGASWDGLTAAAAAQGLEAPYTIAPPASHHETWTVTESATTWPMDNDAIAVHGYSGDVLDRVDFEDEPLPAKLTSWGIYFHLGMLFGLPNLLFLAATAVGLVVLVVLGYRMWWQRRPTRQAGRGPGPTYGRGALRRAPLWLTLALFAVAGVVASYVPLFGLTLVAFLVVDVALGLRARLRTRA